MAIKEIRYRGLLIADCPFPGESKEDGMTPQYATGVRVGRGRWLILYDTVDSRGWDVWRGIFYQVRADAPDGLVIKEAALCPPRPACPQMAGGRIWRHCGAPGVFGTPADAGAGRPHAGVFAVTWINMAMVETGTQVQRASREQLKSLGWTEGDIEKVSHCLETFQEMMHLRFDTQAEDIRVVSPPVRLEQRPAPAGSAGGLVPSGTERLEAFDGPAGIAVRMMEFNTKMGLYEWTRTGPFAKVAEGVNAAEASLVRVRTGKYVISVRGFDQGGSTWWFRTADPLQGLGTAVSVPATYGQRHAVMCGDGIMRLFTNDRGRSPYGDRRNPLFCWDVDPDTLEYTNLRTVMDARKHGLRFREPFVDQEFLFPSEGNRQLVSHRTIAARQVADQSANRDITQEEWQDGGVHYSEIVYK